MEHAEKKAMCMFWRKDKDSLNALSELTEGKRFHDKWLEVVLQQARQGCEEWETYCFTHGLPTRNVGSWFPGQLDSLCGNAVCKRLATEVWPELFKRGCSWSVRKQME